MEQKSARQIQAELAMPFAPEDLEWRLQITMEEKLRGMAMPYVTNRAIQNRLDDVVGPENWYNDFKPWHSIGKKESQICGISIYFEGRGFVTKWDGAEDSDIEPVKGGLSDSMKRAAYQWGIGRILYNMDTVWVEIEKRNKGYAIKDSERSKLDDAYMKMLKKLGLTAAPPGGVQSTLTPKNTRADRPAQELGEQQNQGAPSGEKPKNFTPAIPPQQLEKPLRRQAAPADTAPAPQTPQAPPAASQAPSMAESAQPDSQLYIVLGAKVQGGMTGSSTLVSLQTPEGKKIQAFARGARTELAAGVVLSDVKLTVKKQDTVVFYMLEAYQIVTSNEIAA